MDRKEFKATRQNAFQQAVGLEIQQQVWTHQHNRMFYLPTVVTNSALDLDELDAAWVLFQQTEIVKQFPHNPIWQKSHFTYSLWRLRWQQSRQLLYERRITVSRISAAPLQMWDIRGDLDRLFVHHNTVGVRDRKLGWLRFDKNNELLP